MARWRKDDNYKNHYQDEYLSRKNILFKSFDINLSKLESDESKLSYLSGLKSKTLQR